MPDSVLDPLNALRRAVTEELAAILVKYQRPVDAPDRLPLRFRSDGKGGELATPLPMAMQLDAQLLADDLNQSHLPLSAEPSGGWLAMYLTDEWEEMVRQFQPAFSPIHYTVAPPPPFPARIDPVLWRLNALVGITDPSIAARLDRGNPAFRVYLAGLRDCGEAANRFLVNECALLYSAISSADARQTALEMIAVADAYVALSAEGALVHRALHAGWRTLEI